MTLTDNLQKVHSVARAQALESFEYFVNTVLGVKLSSSLCDEVQRLVEFEDLQGAYVILTVRYEGALTAWLSVIQKGPKLLSAPTETFQWLFGEFIERAA